MLCCGYTLTDFPISIRLTSLALWQSNDCPSASKATLMNMDKYFRWIHYERLHNHNKSKHNKTVCLFFGIYCSFHYFFFFLVICYCISQWKYVNCLCHFNVEKCFKIKICSLFVFKWIQNEKDYRKLFPRSYGASPVGEIHSIPILSMCHYIMDCFCNWFGLAMNSIAAVLPGGDGVIVNLMDRPRDHLTKCLWVQYWKFGLLQFWF